MLIIIDLKPCSSGLGTSRKYVSTCECVVATAAAFAPPRHRIEVRREIFRRRMFSHMLRDGDAAASLAAIADQWAAGADDTLAGL